MWAAAPTDVDLEPRHPAAGQRSRELAAGLDGVIGQRPRLDARHVQAKGRGHKLHWRSKWLGRQGQAAPPGEHSWAPAGCCMLMLHMLCGAGTDDALCLAHAAQPLAFFTPAALAASSRLACPAVKTSAVPCGNGRLGRGHHGQAPGSPTDHLPMCQPRMHSCTARRPPTQRIQHPLTSALHTHAQ